MKTRKAFPVRIFVGSSTQADNRGLTPAIVKEVRRAFIPHATVVHWRDIFPATKFILSSLLDEAGRSDFAVLILSQDDVSKEKQVPITKANVLFECGFFIGRFGSDRVAQVVEPDVDWPSDLGGVVNIPIPRVSGSECERVAKVVAAELARAWGKRPRALESVGLAHAVKSLEIVGPAAHEAVLLSKDSGKGGAEPLVIDFEVIKTAYKDALNLIDGKFWTTSFLKSNFWNESRAEMLQANQDLLDRLGDKRSLRRLFLLPYPEHEFFDDQRFSFEAMRERGRTNKAKEELEQLKRFRNDMKKLSEAGFEMKVAHARKSDAWDHINKSAGREYLQDDTEIAIYDEWRVDCFSGAQGGGIDRLSTFLPYMRRFAAVESAANRYFETLWPDLSEHDLVGFLDRLIAALEEVVDRITHAPDFTFRFDGANNDLKEAELQIVIDAIRTHGVTEKCQKYLDIGTCTGRYPFTLRDRQLIAPEAEIVAIDSDSNCYQHTLANFRQEKLDPTKNNVVWKDFLSWSENRPPQFDLITCMLGTISYFGTRKPNGVAFAISRMAALLRPGGILIMGSWSDLSIRRKVFLECYEPAALDQLAECTPTEGTLEAAFSSSGLVLSPRSGALDRLDVYVAEKP